MVCSLPPFEFTDNCLLDITDEAGDPDLSIDLSACVTLASLPLTPAVKATSRISVQDITNGNVDALLYSYLSVNG